MITHPALRSSPNSFGRAFGWAAAQIALAALLSICSMGAFAQVSPFGAPFTDQGNAVQKHGVVIERADKPATLVEVPKAVQGIQKQLLDVTAQQVSGAQAVSLPYAEHEVYTIPIRTGMFTTFLFPKDEPVRRFVVSNPGAVQVGTDKVSNAVIVRLVQPIALAATAVTSTRAYYLEIKPATGAWYQGVSWTFMQSGGGDVFGAPPMDGVYAGTAASDSVELPHDASGLYSGEPNFAYHINGRADFKPVAVWDNGRFTWIQFKKNLNVLPAVFLQDQNGLSIVNYTVHDDGTQILVNRLMPKFVLKVGKDVVTVTAER